MSDFETEPGVTPEAGETPTNAGSLTPSWDFDEPPRKSRPGGGNGMDRDAPLPATLDAEPPMMDDSEFSAEFEALKTSLHRKLLERLNLSSLSERNRDEAEEEVAKLVRHMLAQENTPLNMEEREKVVEHLVYEIFGLGPRAPSEGSDDLGRPRQRFATAFTSSATAAWRGRMSRSRTTSTFFR